MGQSKEDLEILDEVEELKDRYFTFDEPVPFCGLTLYPVKLKDYKDFMVCSRCLLLNRADDFKAIKLTNLEYLLSKMEDEKEGPMWSSMFSKLLEICLHVKPGFKCEKCGHYMSYIDFFAKYQAMTQEELAKIDIELCDECHEGKLIPSLTHQVDEETKKKFFVIDGHEIKKSEFNKLRKFLLYQNLPDFKDDEFVAKEIRDDQAERQRLLSKDAPTATLEEKIVAVCTLSSYTIETLKDLSMRKFLMIFNSVTSLVDYTANKIGLMSGMASLPKGEKLPHWVYHDDKSLYGKAVDAQDLKNQIQSL